MGRKKENFKLKVFKKTDDLPAEWDDFLPENHFLKSNSLNLYEEMQLPNLSFQYAMLIENNTPVALGYFQKLKIVGQHLDSSRMTCWQSVLLEWLLKLIQPKLLISGHLFRHDIQSFYSKTEDAFQTFKQYQYILKSLCKKYHAALLKDVPEHVSTYFSNFEPQFLQLRNDISMLMEIPAEWGNIDDYEHALKHKYAQRYRKLTRSFGSIKFTELDAASVSKYKNEIFELYKQVSLNQQVRLGMLNRNFMPFLKNKYPDDLKIWACFENEKMIAFASAWVRPEEFDMFYIGFDYEKNKDFQLYFNILFQSINQAIAHGCRRVILGRTALEAKARIGCKPKYLHTFLLIKNRLIRSLVLRVQNDVQGGGGAWEERHPFK